MARLVTSLVNAQADLVKARLANGYLRIYDGTRPATADLPVDGHTQLAELRFSSPAGGVIANGSFSGALLPDSSADASGNATWFRVYEDDGVTAVFDGLVGVSTGDLRLTQIAIESDKPVRINSFTYTVPRNS